MPARSRSVVMTALTLLLAAGLVAGCGKKAAKTEIRLPRTATTAADDWSAASDANGVAGAKAGAPGFGTNDWGPGGAPEGTDLASGLDVTRSGDFMNGKAADSGVPSGAVIDETGSLANTASAAGVEDAALSAELEMIHFPFDSYEIADEFKTVLTSHAEWLKANSTVMVQVEGHCDERGTEEYNIALGQKRADAVRTFLSEAGVDGNRISTVSYGKMRPLSFDQTDESHNLNRRAMFLVYQVDNSVAAAY